MPKKSVNPGTALDQYVDLLLNRSERTGTVTEDEIQIALKDIDVSDAQLNSLYKNLRERGIEIVSAGDEDASLDDDAGLNQDDDL